MIIRALVAAATALVHITLFSASSASAYYSFYDYSNYCNKQQCCWALNVNHWDIRNICYGCEGQDVCNLYTPRTPRPTPRPTKKPTNVACIREVIVMADRYKHYSPFVSILICQHHLQRYLRLYLSHPRHLPRELPQKLLAVRLAYRQNQALAHLQAFNLASLQNQVRSGGRKVSMAMEGAVW
eukprot:scaffold3800_cov87-Skeletonema_dohrnii-CCMP3373.AAC.4